MGIDTSETLRSKATPLLELLVTADLVAIGEHSLAYRAELAAGLEEGNQIRRAHTLGRAGVKACISSEALFDDLD